MDVTCSSNSYARKHSTERAEYPTIRCVEDLDEAICTSCGLVMSRNLCSPVATFFLLCIALHRFIAAVRCLSSGLHLDTAYGTPYCTEGVHCTYCVALHRIALHRIGWATFDGGVRSERKAYLCSSCHQMEHISNHVRDILRNGKALLQSRTHILTYGVRIMVLSNKMRRASFEI